MLEKEPMAVPEIMAVKVATAEEEGTPEKTSRSIGMGEQAAAVPSPEVGAATAVSLFPVLWERLVLVSCVAAWADQERSRRRWR